MDGIAGDVDLNYAYENYPAIIRGAKLNGWGAQDKPAEAPEGETVRIPREDWDTLCATLQAAVDAFKKAGEGDG